MIKNGESQTKINKYLLIVLALFVNSAAFAVTISGYVSRIDGTPLVTATATASGVGSKRTNLSGYYQISVPNGWTGTLSVSLSGYSFTDKYYTNVTADQTNQNFTGFQPKISGYIKDNFGVDISGVTVSASGGSSVTSNSSGYYEIFVPYNWSGTLSATLPGYVFTNKSYANLTTNQTNQNYTGIIKYGGGIGEPNNPYQIWTAEQMNTIGTNSADWGKCFKLMADIDMSAYTGTQYKMIGYSATRFTGKFDGNDHVIRNLTYNDPTRYYVGLFSAVGSGAEIKNLGLENVNISGSNGVGGLIGEVFSFTNDIVIFNCYSAGTVSGKKTVGGLIGYNDRGTVSSCHSTASVSGDETVGGLIGIHAGGTIINCYTSGNVTGSPSKYTAGGLVGAAGSTVTNCYSTAAVTGGIYVGGLIGTSSGTVNNCYSTGTVNGYKIVGGLVGSGGTVAYCYSTGTVTGTEHVGGLLGYSGWPSSCFWDIQASGQDGSAGGIGLTTSQMKTMSIYQNAGWADKGWVIEDGVDYPHLSWEGTAGASIPDPLPVPLYGSGAQEDPYQVWTTEDFALLSWYVSILDKHITLMDDFDLDGVEIYPIGDLGPFTGSFNGNSHRISNVVICQPGKRNVGIFGYVGTNGVVKNLGIKDVNISGGDNVGGLIGFNNGGTVSSCYSTGNILNILGTGNYIGGLVGQNNGTVTSCYSNTTVSGVDNVGGLVGLGGTVAYCYSNGLVNGNNYIGGLIGEGSNYVTASFWDIQTSSQNTSYGGTGLATVQMKQLSTYQDAGWVDKGWVIDDGVDYPHLEWEGTNGIPISTSPLYVGSGTPQDPYQIWTPQQMNSIGNNLNYWDKCFILMADVNMSAYVGMQYNIIGNDITFFTGEFDGNGHKILNLTYNYTGKNYVGLFGYISSGAEIKNLGLENLDITGNYQVGGLIGHNENGTVINCYITGSVKGDGAVGGLIGVCEGNGTVDNCHATGVVVGISVVGGLIGSNKHIVKNSYSTSIINVTESYIGGLIGENYGSVDTCYSANTGGISGFGNVGGLIGYHHEGIVSNSYSTSSVSGDREIGGLIGGTDAGTAIINSYSKGTINGFQNVGGLIGYNGGSNVGCYSTSVVNGTGNDGGFIGGLVGTNGGTISNCYSTGSVNASLSQEVGGLIGLNGNAVVNCYSTGYVSGKSQVGGFAGVGGYNTACFWDTQTSGKIKGIGDTEPDPNGVIGKTTVEMMTQSTFTSAGWDFVGETVNGPNDFWRMCVDGVSYPKLKFEFAQTDYICPDGVDFTDYAMLAMKWLQTDYGDANGLELTDDGLINFDEFAIMASLWKVSGCEDCGGADYSKDGDIDEDDLVILGQNWLRTDYGSVDGIDLTADGKIDYEELNILAENWLQ